MSTKSQKNGDVESLIENIDQQLLLRLLDALIEEQELVTPKKG